MTKFTKKKSKYIPINLSAQQNHVYAMEKEAKKYHIKQRHLHD